MRGAVWLCQPHKVPMGISYGNQMSEEIDNPPNDTELQKQIEALQAEKERLQAKNHELIGDQKKLKSKFDGIDPTEVADLRAKASQLDGLDPAHLEKLNAIMAAAKDETERKILQEGGPGAWYEHRVKGEREGWERKLTETDKQRKELAAKVADFEKREKQRLFDGTVTSAAGEFGKFLPGIEDLLTTIVQGHVAEDTDDGPRLAVDGNTFYSPEDTTRIGTIAEFVKYKLPELRPMLLKQSSGVGAKQPGGKAPGENPWLGTKARERVGEKLQIERDNPELAKRMKAEAKATA